MIPILVLPPPAHAWRVAVLDRLVALLPEAPYILEGRYSWLPGPEGTCLGLDLLFPELPLAVDVLGPHYGSWETAREFVDRETWEALQASQSTKEVALQRVVSLPYLRITPEDPVDPNSLRLRLQRVLGSSEVIS